MIERQRHFEPWSTTAASTFELYRNEGLALATVGTGTTSFPLGSRNAGVVDGLLHVEHVG